MATNHNGLKKTGAILGAGTVLASMAYATIKPNTAKVDAAPVPVCVPSADTHPFTFASGQGENDAVLTIDGSGAGEGAVCWNAAKGILEARMKHPGNPQIGDEVQLPNEIHPAGAETTTTVAS